MQPASWRGVPFFITSSGMRRGRRVAVHEYPYRDAVWVEDLGRGKREIAFTGFLVGDDLLAQEAALTVACEAPGPGELIHPVLGSVRCALLGYETTQRAEVGRVVEVNLSFLETADSRFPNFSADTQASVGNATSLAPADFASDFQRNIVSPLRLGIPIVRAVFAEVQRVAAFVQSAVHDPLSALLRLSGLSSVASYGRSAFGAVTSALRAVSSFTGSGLFGGGSGPQAAAALASASAARVAAVAASKAAASAASAVSYSSTAPLCAAVATMAAASRTASADPADQVRLLGQVLASVGPSAPSSSGGLGLQLNLATAATRDLVRRSLVTEMANAAASYQPTSYDDAAAMRLTVCAAIDAEIDWAGDVADDVSYASLRNVRRAVAADLTARGANLARMITVTRNTSLPSVVLAHQLYSDSTREGELVAEADPAHPAFMPPTFIARAK